MKSQQTLEQQLNSNVIQKQYFSIKQLPQNQNITLLVNGKCQKMISSLQQNERGVDEFERYPFQPVAKFFRNKSYDRQEQVRSPQMLDRTLQYLKDNFFVCLLEDHKNIRNIILGSSKKRRQNEETQQQKANRQKRLEKIMQIIYKEQQAKQTINQDQSFVHLNEGQNLANNQNSKISTDSHDKRTHIISNKKLFEFTFPQKLTLFLQSRLQAIRCQLFAQGVVFPRLTLELLKCQILLYTIKQNQCLEIEYNMNAGQQEIKLVGLDNMLDTGVRDILLQDQRYKTYYQQALSIAIFKLKYGDLLKLIQDHEQILEDDKLSKLFKLRQSIQRGNYHRYFVELANQRSPLILCMLLTFLPSIRQRLCDVLTSAKMDVSKQWLAYFMGFKVKKEEQNQLINLNKNQYYIRQKIQSKKVESRKKQIKKWIKTQRMFDCLLFTK